MKQKVRISQNQDWCFELTGNVKNGFYLLYYSSTQWRTYAILQADRMSSLYNLQSNQEIIWSGGPHYQKKYYSCTCTVIHKCSCSFKNQSHSKDFSVNLPPQLQHARKQQHSPIQYKKPCKQKWFIVPSLELGWRQGCTLLKTIEKIISAGSISRKKIGYPAVITVMSYVNSGSLPHSDNWTQQC